jgi:hypothetical protein
MQPNFFENPHNVRLNLATDGVNPFGEKNSNWSTWPILLFNYNLPPWLVTEKFFVMLALIILSKESIRMHNIDVYMALLIEELQELWKGVVAYDVAKVEGEKHFILQAMLKWTIHDYLTYGLVAGCVHQGYKVCPICRPNLTSHHSLELGKVVYEGSRCWLPRGHPYQNNQNPNHFSGKKKLRNGPQLVTINDILRSAAEY